MQIREPKIIGVYVPGAVFERLDAIAQEQKRTKSQVVRLMLERALAKEERTL